jgi:PAS domain S-box-containing protein
MCSAETNSQSVSHENIPYDYLFENLNDTVLIHDLTGNLLHVNSAACQQLGYAREELLAMQIKHLDIPESAEQYPSRIQHLQEMGTLVFETQHRRKRGDYVAVEVNARMIHYGGIPAVLSIIRDISQFKQTEDALRQAEAKYRHIFENAVEGIFQSTVDGRYLSVNSAMARIFGYASPEDMIASVGSGIESRIYVERHQRAEFMRALEDHDVVQDFEAQNYRKNGERIWTRTNARVVRDAQGTLLYYEGFLEDVTERKQAERAVRDSEARYRTLMEQAADMIIITDAYGKIINVNSQACAMLGYTRGELLNLAVTQVVASHDRECFGLQIDLLSPGKTFVTECTMRRQDASQFPAEVATKLLSDGTIQGIIRDISERKRLESEIQAMLEAQQKWNADLENTVRAKTSELRELAQTRDQLLRQIMTAQEEERRRVARELHDDTSQALTALIANLAVVQTHPPSKAKAHLDEIKSAVVEILKGVNRIVLDLRPTLLDDYGLISALSWYAGKRLDSDHTHVEITVPESELRLPSTVETILFRIGQEAITNIAKYARATRVQINLNHDAGANMVTLTIEDNGIGFALAHNREGNLDRPHLGLIGMQERVQLIGGQLEIQSTPNHGTLVSVSVPLDHASARK